MINLSVIIVSYNVASDLKNCLQSIFKYTKDLNFEVIVVDNNSSDNSVSQVKKYFPQVNLIKSKENLGFGKANNLGANQAKGEYLLFLNPDTLIDQNLFKLSLEEAKKLSNLGVYSPRLQYSDGTTQPSGGYFPNLFRVVAWHTALDEVPFSKNMIKPIHPSNDFYKDSPKLDWVTGAFMLIPKKVFEKINGFDPKIFMYGEELELCYRIHQAGYKVYYSPKYSLTHLQGKSSSSSFALVSETKGINYFFQKHKPAWQLPLVKLITKFGALLRYLLFGIICHDEKKRQAYLQILRAQ